MIIYIKDPIVWTAKQDNDSWTLRGIDCPEGPTSPMGTSHCQMTFRAEAHRDELMQGCKEATLAALNKLLDAMSRDIECMTPEDAGCYAASFAKKNNWTLRGSSGPSGSDVIEFDFSILLINTTESISSPSSTLN